MLVQRVAYVAQDVGVVDDGQAVYYACHCETQLTEDELAEVARDVDAELLGHPTLTRGNRDSDPTRTVSDAVEQRVGQRLRNYPPEFGPDFANPEDAVAWAMERADVVIVRLGIASHFSAGRSPVPGQADLPTWPPSPADVKRLTRELLDRETFAEDG